MALWSIDRPGDLACQLASNPLRTRFLEGVADHVASV
jgi:hypothetical protein